MAFMRRTQSCRRQARRGALLGAAALSVLAASEASAQFAYGYVRTFPAPVYGDDLPPMPPRAVVYRLQDRGFTEIGRPRFDGRAYVVDATNPAGNRIRLFVDAQDGGVLGRQRLDTPYYPSGRVARAAPGYGWTEDDVAPRRAARDPEGLLPPADIPLPRPSLHAEIDRAPAITSRPGSSAAPFGVNPEAKTPNRAESGKSDKARAATAAQRKTAKLTQPAAPRVAPEAPVLPAGSVDQKAPVAAAAPATGGTAETAKAPEAKAPEPVTAATEAPKSGSTPLAPAAKLPLAPEEAAGTSVTAQAAEKPAAKDAANQGWQDPPTGDQKRNVRVIGGAIVVPGGEAAPAAAN